VQELEVPQSAEKPLFPCAALAATMQLEFTKHIATVMMHHDAGLDAGQKESKEPI